MGAVGSNHDGQSIAYQDNKSLLAVFFDSCAFNNIGGFGISGGYEGKKTSVYLPFSAGGGLTQRAKGKP